MIAELVAPDSLRSTRRRRGGSKLDEVVTISGVGFFEKIHGGKHGEGQKIHGGKHGEGQVGHAPNGIELHSVLAICFGENCRLE